ncbi:10082_t:CDS:2 [Scutellospora calospora]|uniref:10082_t:CDS:1 n=1 Tax=Scutellospora calospora TaxID=85575 RepID=A0ACA9LEX7_9GLOM|nr:10082_t:CDS:2 [Scutellospora calospora]
MPPSNEIPIDVDVTPSEPAVEEELNTLPTTDLSTNDLDKNTKLVDHQSLPLPFVFPQNIRNIYLSTVTNLSTMPSSNDSASTTEDLIPKWDEICFQWCKQQDKNRENAINPTCKMLCFRKISNNTKHEFFKKKFAVHEQRLEQDGKNPTYNATQVLYGKGDGKEGVNYSKVGPRNFLDGYFIYYIKGLKGCQKHTEDMKNDELLNRTWVQVKSEEYEIDLGEKFERTKTETNRIIRRAFTPGYQLGKRYIESWSDGTQTAFFRRFYESVQRMDAMHMVQDNVKKIVEVWIKGSNSGNRKDNGFGNSDSSNDIDHRKEKSENDSESNNEKDK